MKDSVQSVFKLPKLLIFSLLFFLMLQVLPGKASAQGVNDFVINKFDAKYELSNQDPQGRLDITETIDLVYSGQNRGILRAIPAVYKDNDVHVTVKSVSRDGKTEPFITYDENGNTVLRIGDPNTYITGAHNYIITYNVVNVITFYDDHDELYWDVNGDQWGQTFQSVTASVASEARPSAVVQPTCFTGSYGETTKNCQVSQASSIPVFSTTQPLLAGETLSIVTGYEKGYFTPPSWMERNWGLLVASPIFLAQLLVGYTAYKRWKTYGKDYKDRGAIAPYFERPKGLSVMQASYILNNNLTAQHISASIIDLSIRGNIRIIEQGEGKKVKHDLELARLPDTYNTEDEVTLLKSLFSSMSVGESIILEDKKYKFAKVLGDISKSLDQKSILAGYYELSPKNAFKKLVPHLLSAIVLFVLGILFADFTKGASVLTSIIMLVSVIIFMSLMTKRSVKGNLIVDHMKGLKLYLEKAEKDRIKMQDAVAAPLAKNSGQPVRNREFFEKLLPYAVAMGVEKSWAKAFADIYTEPPEWYQGNWTTFSTASLATSIASTASATSLSFSSPASSGSSGSGGGGFSGGGGGGGGGGGW